MTNEIDTREEDQMNRNELHAEHFEGKAKKVGEVVIGNEAIPVFEFSVKPKYDEDLDDFLMLNKDFSKYEQEFLDLAQKLRDDIEKETPVSLSFITSEIIRYLFRDVTDWGGDNPVKGFIEAWAFGGGWGMAHMITVASGCRKSRERCHVSDCI